MPNVIARWINGTCFIILACIFCMTSLAAANPISDADIEELNRYRIAVPEMRARIDEYERRIRSIEFAKAHYAASVLDQRVELTKIAVDAYQWQLFSSKIVLLLVALLTLSGIFLGGYQLIVSANIYRRTPKSDADAIKADEENTVGASLAGLTTLELSKEKASLQTSAVGVVVLFISGIFLYLFLDRVYEIKNYDFSQPIGNMQSLAEQPAQ